MTIGDAIEQIEKFKGPRLGGTIGRLEETVVGKSADEIRRANMSSAVNAQLLQAAFAVKRASAQIDVVIHAAGILYALPFLLDEDEVVESLSIGAANAASNYDLVTDRRLAEFKFIQWRSRGNAVRNKTLFQDFYRLARAETAKSKYLYLLQTKRPLRFLGGNRDILKVLDRNRRLADDFEKRFGKSFKTVGEFYSAFRHEIRIANITESVPEFQEFLADIAD